MSTLKFIIYNFEEFVNVLNKIFSPANTFCMIIIFVRAVIILTLLVVVMRLMGKRQIGEMQPYEFIITLLIAEVACVPMSDVSIPLLYGVVSIIAIFIIHQVLSLLEQLGVGWKSIISGKPSIVIDANGVNRNELKKNNLDVEDLIESLRSTGNFSLDEVKYAILEANGKLSVVQNPDAEGSGELPVLAINDGKFIDKNLSVIGTDKNRIAEFLKNNEINSVKSVEVMTIDGSGKVYLQEKDKKYSVKRFHVKEGAAW